MTKDECLANYCEGDEELFDALTVLFERRINTMKYKFMMRMLEIYYKGER